MEARDHPVKALIVADGDVSPAAVSALLADGEPALVVAADGGALKAELLGLAPDVVVGDLDSLSPATVERLRAGGTEVQLHPRAKDASDTQLALAEAVRRGASRLIIVGGLGGRRVDHSLANLLLPTLPDLAGCDVVLLDGATSVRVIGGDAPAAVELTGRRGDIVSLLPLTPTVEGVTTDGLHYPLAGEPLLQGSSRGLSNVMEADRAAIRTRAGRLAVIHAPGAAAEVGDG